METIGYFVVTLVIFFSIVYLFSEVKEKGEQLRKDFEYYKSASPLFYKQGMHFKIGQDDKEIKHLLSEMKFTSDVKSEVAAYETRLKSYKSDQDKRNIFLFAHLEVIWRCFIQEASEKDVFCFSLSEDVLLKRITKALDSEIMSRKFLNDALEVDVIQQRNGKCLLLGIFITHPYKKNEYNKLLTFGLDEGSTLRDIEDFKY